MQHSRPEYCRTCVFRATDFGGQILDRADTGTCGVYKEPDKKPDAVYWQGAKCENYSPADDKPQAVLFGLAVGDALGVPVEFRPRGSFRVECMQGYGTYNQPPGTWSDDTSLALALADSLLPQSLNLESVARRFVAWRDESEYTPHGETFDIGNATRCAIERMKRGVAPTEAGGKGERDNGNGSLMRIAPLVFYMVNKPPQERFEITRQASSLTHAHPISVTACFIYLEMLNLLRKGRDKKAAYTELKAAFECHAKFLDGKPLAIFDRILKADISTLSEKEIRSSGYVVDTLEAAFWSFLTTSGYKEAVLEAVNLGDDTDTTGAVTGAMAGLYYGLKNIPQEWLDALVRREFIRDIAIRMPRWDLLPGAQNPAAG